MVSPARSASRRRGVPSTIVTSASLGKHGAAVAPPPPAAAGGGEAAGGGGGGRHVEHHLGGESFVQHLYATPADPGTEASSHDVQIPSFDPGVTGVQVALATHHVGGLTQVYWSLERCPQSLQSVPKLQSRPANSAPGPPSLHSPSLALSHVFEQYVCPAVAIATRAIAAASIEWCGGRGVSSDRKSTSSDWNSRRRRRRRRGT